MKNQSENIIPLGNFQVRQLDSLNVALERRTPKGWVIIAYCGNVTSALKTYVNVAMANEKKWHSIEDVTKALLELNETLKEIEKKLGV